ncbi:TPA: hypothetical protein DCX15_04260 [bacterium]|nr:hypothetical protein [bacterium]
MADEGGKIVGATSGTYSGIDWMSNIIPQLVNIERRQIGIWERQKAEYKLEQDAWRDVNMRFSSLKDRSYDLLQDSTWKKVGITSSDNNYVTATGGGGAVAGMYDFRVRQLATNSTLVSSNDLNNHAAKRSSKEVISGASRRVNLATTTNPWTQFDNAIDGNITISNAVGVSAVFTISGYSSVQALIDAVNTDSTLNAGDRGVQLRYNSETDRFIIESTGSATVLGLNETGTNSFFKEVKITINHPDPPWTDQDGTKPGDDVGINPTVKLSEVNFDITLSDSGSFKVNGTTINWTKTGNTLNGIMSAINTSAAGVSAFYDESLDKMILSSKAIGAYNIEVKDISGNLATALKINNVACTLGQEAKFTINSTNDADEITKNSNTFTIAGVTFTLNKANTSTGTYGTNWYANTDGKTTVTVAQDLDAIKKSIKDWVDQWNSSMGFLRSKMAYDAAARKISELTGNGTAIGIQQQVYTLSTTRYDEKYNDTPILAKDMNQLAHIGITLGAFRSGSEGKLVVDDAVLTKALTERLEDAKKLFGVAKDGGKVKDYGVAYRVYKYTDDLTKLTGTIAGQINLYSNPHKTGLMDRIDQRIEDYEKYVKRYEMNLRKQFEAMEMTISQMKTQQNMFGAYLMGRMLR